MEILQLDKITLNSLTKSSNQTNSRMLISNITIVFQIAAQNTQIRHFCFQIQELSFFHGTLQLDKFEEADFKYDNSFFKFPAQRYPNKVFLVPNLRIFNFA